MPDDLLTVQQVATMRGVKPGTVRAWLVHKTHPLPATKFGAWQWQIDPEILAAYQPHPVGRSRRKDDESASEI